MKGEKQLEGRLGPTCQLTDSLTSSLLPPLSSQPILTVPARLPWPALIVDMVRLGPL